MKLVILDRDGVVTQPATEGRRPVDANPLPGALEAIARLCQAGFRVFLATNQAGIGEGRYDYDALMNGFERLQRGAAEFGGRIEGVAFAPEPADTPTELRKPNPGMLRDLARRLQIGLDEVWFIGDQASDIEAARSAGARPVLVRTGAGRRTEAEADLDGVRVYDDLGAAARALIAGPA